MSDPEDYATVAHTCLKKNIFYEFLKPWIGQGLVTEPRKSYLGYWQIFYGSSPKRTNFNFLVITH